MKIKFKRWGVLFGAVSFMLFIGVWPLTVQAQTPVPTPTPPLETSPIPFVHTVEEGENPTYIAGLYEVTVEDLLALNNLSLETILFVGQSLIIPGGQGESVGTLYTVQIGDTLDQVAAIFNSEPVEVVQLNQMVNPYQPLLAGEQLVIISKTG